MSWDKDRTHPRNFISGDISFFTFEWARFGPIWDDLDLKVNPNTDRGKGGGSGERGEVEGEVYEPTISGFVARYVQ